VDVSEAITLKYKLI